MKQRILVPFVVASLGIASACGADDTGSDSAAGDATSDTVVAAATDSAATTPDATSDPNAEPVPTIAPDIPEVFLPGVGPMAVVGDPLPTLPESGEDPAIGQPAPVLIGETMDGVPIRVDAAADGPTWVIFLAHWCPHCNDEIPVINEIRDEARIPENINVVAVSTAFNPDRPNWPPAEWLADKDWTFTAMHDGVDTVEGSFIALSAFGMAGFPASVLIDGDGNVAHRWTSGRSADELVDLLTEYLA